MFLTLIYRRQNGNELKKLRVDHDQAIANLADNMNKWNDTIRDLSREFHEFQKLMTQQQQKLQTSFYECTGRQNAAAAAGDTSNANNNYSSLAGKPTSGGYVVRQNPMLPQFGMQVQRPALLGSGQGTQV